MDVRAGVILVGWLVGWWLLWRAPLLSGAATVTPPLADDELRSRAARCTVVIPARNEAASLGNLLASLERQRVAPGQVIVVDDRSEDDTAAIATRHAARAAAHGTAEVVVVRGEAVPIGWTGKAWACHQGSERATGERLVFLDADVVLADDAFEAIVRRCPSVDDGLVSVQPFHTMRRAYERFSALFNIVSMMGVGTASLRPARPARGAFGPCLITSRADYDLVGGHRGVRAAIVDDLALAANYRAAGLPVDALAGGALIAFRMYPAGLRQLIEGWSKNMATGASAIGLARLVLVGFWITCLLLSVQSLIELVVGSSGAGWPYAAPVVALLAYGAFVVQWGVMLRQLGNFGWGTALLYPAALGIFLLVFARSAYLTVVRRRVVWRGREVPLAGGANDGAAVWP